MFATYKCGNICFAFVFKYGAYITESLGILKQWLIR